jgi:8-oxo-dGTP pyrophosphatase MutT (NUDIX family)
MKLDSLFEYGADDETKLKYKAGVIPYVKVGDEIEMLFVISSNPAFGGPDPGIIKGGADDGETPKETAIREMKEEVGIDENLIVEVEEVFTDRLRGLVSEYKFHVFACQLDKKPELKIDTFEIGEAVWMTIDDFNARGRKSQLHIVKQCIGKLHGKSN